MISKLSIQTVDEQAEFTKKVTTEFGLQASQAAVAKRVINIEDECRQQVEKLSQLFQERLQYIKMVEVNTILQKEINHLEKDLRETKETAQQLEAEGEELMMKINDMRVKKNSDNRVPQLKQEVRELQVKLSNMIQAGKRPTVKLDMEEEEDEDTKMEADSSSEDLSPQEEADSQTSTLPRAHKFVFKRKLQS